MLSLLRHGLSIAGGVTAVDGWFSKDDGQQLVGAIMAAVSLLWSFWRKYCRHKAEKGDVPVRTLVVVIGLGALVAVQGCASYLHTSPTGERTSFNSCLMFGKAAAVKSDVQDIEYSRRVSIGNISGGTEAEKLAPLLEAFAKGAVQGAK